jgi:hypothetical protein
VLIDMPVMKRVQVAIMEIIDVVIMPDCCVAATSTVFVGMVFVDCMGSAHQFVSFREILSYMTHI